MFVTRDGGTSWRLACSDVFGVPYTALNPSPTALLRGGTMVTTGGVRGMWISRDGGCSGSHDNPFGEASAVDLSTTPDGSSLYAMVVRPDADAGPSGLSSQVWLSNDDAATFSPVGTSVPQLLTNLAVAPSNPAVMYAVRGEGIDPATLLVSRDGGVTWASLLVALPSTDVVGLRILGIHPTDPDLVFLSEALQHVFAAAEPPTSVMVSADGGETMTTIFKGQGAVFGLTFSRGGEEVFFGGPQDGLLRADVAALRARDPTAVKSVSATPVYGLTWTADGLYAGGNEWGASLPFTIGVSHDRGITFEPVMGLCGVVPLACGRNGAPAPECAGAARDYVTDILTAHCGADGAVSAGAPPAKASDGGSPSGAPQPNGTSPDGGASSAARPDLNIQSGCSAASSGSDGAAPWLFAAALVIRAARARRRDR